MKKFLHDFIPTLLGAIILTCVAFYNGYPLVYSDTGAYIHSGAEKLIPYDRPIIYGLFLKYFSLKTSLWFIVIVQNFITSFLIFLLFKKLELNKKHFFLTIIILTFTTSIGWYSNQLMPDFLAPIVILALFLLMFYKLSKLNFSLLSIILVFGMISHFSHLLMCSLIVLVFLALRLIPRVKVSKNISKKSFLITAGIVFSAWIILPTINYSYEKKFILSKGSHVFLLAHLNKKGTLYPLLEKYCDQKELEGCKICDFKEDLPQDITHFIWKGDFLENLGGWEGSKEEFDKIIKLSLVDGRFLVSNIFKSLNAGFRQLVQLNVGEGLTSYNEKRAPYEQIHWRYRHELNEYANSKQNKNEGVNLNFKVLTIVQWFVVFISLISIVLFLTNIQSVNRSLLNLLFFVGIGLLMNAMCTAGLSSPYERYQSRVIWLLPLVVLCIWTYKLKDKSIFKLL